MAILKIQGSRIQESNYLTKEFPSGTLIFSVIDDLTENFDEFFAFLY